jgi:hypothetical protein
MAYIAQEVEPVICIRTPKLSGANGPFGATGAETTATPILS